jgi:molecular chaperone DnaJ
MNLKEAYEVMGIPSTSTPEEAKKQYKKLSKTWHPDVNKDAGAEAKFKRINEAYQKIQLGKDDEPEGWNPFGGEGHGPFRNVNFNPFGNENFSPFGRQKPRYTSNIDIETTISFKDSVQGGKVDLKYSRQIKCPHCHGNGHKPINNGCKTCDGRGQVTQIDKKYGTVFVQTCKDCNGKSQTVPCKECHVTGVVSAEVSVNVSIPPAINDGATLRLQTMGNYAGSVLGISDQYTDVHLHIKVTPEPGLVLKGRDVVSTTEISLLEALQGCTKNIKTIDGEKEVNISRGIRNKDEILLKVGDNKNITHRLIVDVNYPDDTDKLIEILSE